ncbi:MAG: DUF4159 domain-containing protein [Pirellulaceae bacterium]
MNRLLTGRLSRLVMLACIIGLSPRDLDAVTADAVQRSIDRGVAFLKKQQSETTGGWQEYVNQSCGLSALCTLALLNCGLDHNDPHVARALDYLRKCEPQRTYSIALQTMVFCQARQPRDLATIRSNVRLLESLMIRRDDGPFSSGGWPYQADQGNGDPSNTQFALLALGAAEERGIPVSPEVFQIAEDYWIRRQQRTGGWSYSSVGQGSPASGSMTCAGIASLVITRGRTGKSQSRIEKGMIRCCGVDEDEKDPIEAGLNWLSNNFLVSANPGVRVHGLYYLYALERVGRLTGQRLIGGHDWYREGAEYLLERQDDFEGFWRGVGHDDSIATVGTSFALLFLGKGKRQVVISRLQHGMAGDWNWHPDSLRQLTQHVERKWERDLTWQTVRLAGATVEELLNSPILFISGNGPLVTTPQQRAVLKQYVEQGGFIFAQATAASGCPAGNEFEMSIRLLMEELFDSPLEKLPANHPIWFAEYRLQPAKLPPNFWLYGVQACCRTSVVYSPVSLACLWELSDPTGRKDLPDRWKPSIEAAVQIGQNVIAYATGRKLRDKLDIPSVIVPEAGLAESPRNVLVIPQLEIGAGGDEAPRALPNLLQWMRRQVAARIAGRDATIGFDEQTLQDFNIVFMHGRYSFTLSEQQRDTLRQFLTTGGTIIASAICGNDAFTQSFRREMQLVLPGAELTPLPADHEALSSRFRGYNLSSVTLRRPVEGDNGIVVAEKVGSPLIEVMQHDQRDCVFFSPLDISCALENQGGIQCPGYDTVDAAKIGINLILYAMMQ